MMHRAIGSRSTCVFIDHGLLRKDEANDVMRLLKKGLGININKYDYSKKFLSLLKGVKDPEKKRAELVAEYKEKFGNPYIAASRGFIDDVIDPAQTRPKIIGALDMLKNKRDALPPKKHGSIPL